MKKVLFAASAFYLATAAGAQAHDWSGFYVGGSLGGASSDATWDDIDSDWTGGIVHDDGEEAVSIGVQGGYNWQWGNFVLGVQGDFTYADLTLHDYFDPFGGGVPEINLEDHLTYIASARMNAGYSFGAWEPYVTVGASYSDLEHSWLEDFDPGDSWPGFDNEVAKVYGVGVNFAMNETWSLGFEALRYDFGSETEFNEDGAFRMEVETEVDAYRLVANYHFN